MSGTRTGRLRSTPGRSLQAIVLLVLLAVTPIDGPPGPFHASPGDLADGPRPNLLILVADDFRGGILGVDGDPRRATPRLDHLASQGVRFDRAYCNSPLCTASRASFITGRMPHAVGVTRLLTPFPRDAITLGSWLSDLGYVTGAFGKMHFNGKGAHGFGERLDTPDWSRFLRDHPPEGGDRRHKWRPFQEPAEVWLNAEARPFGLTEAAMEARYYADHAEAFLNAHKTEPFALVVSFYEPHAPFHFPDEWAGRFRPDQFGTFPVSESDRAEQPMIFRHLSPSQVQGIQASYFASVSFVDHEIGRVLDALDRAGLASNTIVVFIGDNGYMLGEHGRFEKHCFYEPSVRVPFLIRWPGKIPPGRKVTDQVELVDLVPTVLELGGMPVPPDLHGRSVAGLALGDPAAKGRSTVVSEYTENEEAMARDHRYKLIVGTGMRRREDGYATGQPLPGPSLRLYDNESDPDETRDLGASTVAAHAEARERLLAVLYDRLVNTRGGRPAVPPGLSRLDAIHWCLVPQD